MREDSAIVARAFDGSKELACRARTHPSPGGKRKGVIGSLIKRERKRKRRGLRVLTSSWCGLET